MKNFFVLILTLLLATSCSWTSNLTGSPSDEKTQESALGEISYEDPSPTEMIYYNDDEELPVPANMMMILAEDEVTQAEIEGLAADLESEIVGEFDFIQLYQFKTPSTNQTELDLLIDKALEYEFVTDSGPILSSVPRDVEGKSCTILDDFYTDGDASSAYEMIGLERAWKLINASGIELRKVKVGVIDSGYNKASADGARIQALNKDDERNTDEDYNNHGTSVANTIGGSWENSGMRGVAGGLGENLEVNVSNVMSKSIYSEIDAADVENPSHYVHTDGQAYVLNTLAEMKEQIENGAEVINYSMGAKKIGPHNHLKNKIYRKFLGKMQEKYPKVVFVAAAGNEGNTGNPLDGTNDDMAGIPADNVVTVGALDSDGGLADYSNSVTTGGEITLSAQGSDVPLGFNEDGTAYSASGTSFSTPQVTGAVAILKSINPNLTAKEIKDILVSTSSKTSGGLMVPYQAGAGVLRIDKAVSSQLKVVMGPAFDEKKLENLSTITATARKDKEDQLHHYIQVNIPEVAAGGTDVTATYSGNGMMTGGSTQHISGPGTLNWDFTFLEDGDSSTVTFTRADSNACTKLRLKTLTPVLLNAKGRWSIAGDSGAIDLSFMSTGGPVSGTWWGGNEYVTWYIDMTGDFDGGDGGAVHGTHSGMINVGEVNSINGNWSGTVHLKEGKASGGITTLFDTDYGPKTFNGSWHVEFPPINMEE
ncbi:S8 family serine peptidase [Candidatus Peregrinibacteria bacterium]|jgi:hypothetical protein|nr:S8 family serine peptidase [Candidatus Peregrinibacteria bacterium]MBT4148449.1 S8 family serine peptidase [Candidatus Peregrinibacteria bacterium]MBT4366544.1 S8 family serine peptidase [Candidatus Peregrinibacteria bacterium]MBT4456490.1 S8 family serine peptidase [Candidatus Peregrinibacteria bacterium]